MHPYKGIYIPLGVITQTCSPAVSPSVNLSRYTGASTSGGVSIMKDRH